MLTQMASSHRLGPPGVKVIAEPTYSESGRLLQTNTVYLPPRVMDWTGETQPVTDLEANWLPKDTLFGRRGYKSPKGFEIWLSVVLMGTDRTSIHKPEYCLESQGCLIGKSEILTVPVQRPHPYDLRVMRLTTNRQLRADNGQVATRRGMYVYWFVADGLLTPTHGERMWWMARDLIRTGVLDRWGYVAYFTECWPGEEEATFERLKEFIAASVPEFQLAAGSRSTPGNTASAGKTDLSGQKN